MAHILSISYDAQLLKTRQMLLEKMGHRVTSARGFAEASRLCTESEGRFDLIVLGHSIPHEDKRAMIRCCVHACSCPVLAMTRENEPPVEEATRSVAADPGSLTAAVREILEERPGAR
jgi:DNA-binding NtrC family response regulator